MADEQHKNGETGAPEPEEVTEVTLAAAPAEAEPAAVAAESTVVMADANEETTQVEAGDGGVTAVAAPTRRPSRMRRLLIGLLVLLSCLAVVISGLTLWTHYTVMNTDGYMNLVGPIGKDPEAIQNLSEYIGGQVIAATDLQQRVTDALPPRVQLLAGPITSYVEDFITKGARKVLSSPKAYDLWLRINRTGHEKIVALLARRHQQRVHRRQRREAQPAAADQPGAGVGGRASCRAGSPTGSARPSSRPALTPRPVSRKWPTGRASRCLRTSARSRCSNPTRSGRRRRR